MRQVAPIVGRQWTMSLITLVKKVRGCDSVTLSEEACITLKVRQLVRG